MKKRESFSLEEDTMRKILDYDKKHNFKNKSLALERMLLERENLLEKVNLYQDKIRLYELLINGQTIVTKPNPEISIEAKDKEEEKENEELMNFYSSALDSMPD